MLEHLDPEAHLFKKTHTQCKVSNYINTFSALVRNNYSLLAVTL